MKNILKKACSLFITLLAAAFLTFLFFDVIPSNAALTKLGMDATKEEISAFQEAMGMNRSLPVRYGSFLKDALTGDFGESIQYRMPVLELLKARFEVTFSIALLAFFLILLFSVPIGVLSAKGKRRFGAGATALFSQLFMAVPPFFLGMLITLFFGVILKWFIPGAYVSVKDNFFQWLSFAVFPAMAIAIPKIGMTVRFLNGEVRKELHADYVRTARSKGLSKGYVLFHHVLLNALVPVITFLAMVMAEILAGSIVVEQVFNLSGVGRLLAVSIANRDYPVVRAIVLYTTAVVVLLNFLADLICRKLDKRIKDI